MENYKARTCFKIIGIMALLLFGLSACGGGGGGVPGIPTIPGIPGGGSGALTVNVYDSLAKPISGAVVTLDAAGATATTGATGKAVFSGLAAGAHDVHVVATGYAVLSAYGVSVASINLTLNSPTSHIRSQGLIRGFLSSDLISLLTVEWCRLANSAMACMV